MCLVSYCELRLAIPLSWGVHIQGFLGQLITPAVDIIEAEYHVKDTELPPRQVQS